MNQLAAVIPDSENSSNHIIAIRDAFNESQILTTLLASASTLSRKKPANCTKPVFREQLIAFLFFVARHDSHQDLCCGDFEISPLKPLIKVEWSVGGRGCVFGTPVDAEL